MRFRPDIHQTEVAKLLCTTAILSLKRCRRTNQDVSTLTVISSSCRNKHDKAVLLIQLDVQTREVLDAMKDDYYKEQVSLLKVDGGASCNNLLMQIQADFLQVS